MILFNEAARTFTLHTDHSTYQMLIGENGFLLHTYYGDRAEQQDFSYLIQYRDRAFSGSPEDMYHHRGYSQDVLPLEYSTFGAGDYRESCLDAENSDGGIAADLRYVSHRIFNGKPKLAGLPAVYADEADAQTLEITLQDRTTGLQAVLSYSVLADYDAITRSVCLTQTGTQPVILRRALSCCLDFAVPSAKEVISFYGHHAGERNMQRVPLQHGKFRVDSVRGTSSHQQNPFWIICEEGTDETHGACYGMSLVYSGNFLAQAELDQFAQLRVVMGIHPQAFAWTLQTGESFQTPEVILTYSPNGFDALSGQLHHLIRTHIMRRPWNLSRPPVLINNWEATYFQFDEKKLLAIAEQAKELGIEMLVMDDGWFGKRDNDLSGLGDWTVNEQKLHGGLRALVDRVNALGMKFGIWFEPEMISPDSDLYRAHPDWCLHMEQRPNVYGRNQLVLDMSRSDVRDYLFDAMAKVLHSANIAYVKWDMNRHLANVWSAKLPAARQGELYHRYVLGVYELQERLLHEFPELLLEGCSGGGGRFDAGMLFYSPQIWCSDNTDAVARLPIQFGTSFGYPIRAIGSHVSICPNHQTGRITPLETRGAVAMMGTFGYELDLCRLSDEEKEIIRAQVAEYKQQSDLICTGEFHRLSMPQPGSPNASWILVSADQRQALFTCIRDRAECSDPERVIRLRGLNPSAIYHVAEQKCCLTGQALMSAGLVIPPCGGDYTAYVCHLQTE